MDQLPDEVLLLILSCLTTKDLIRCSGVNRRLQRLAHDKTLWLSVNLSSCAMPLRSLGKLVTKHGVRSLILKQATIQDPSSWRNAFPGNQLQTINLSKAQVSARGIGHILKSTTHLIHLNVSGCVINHIAYKAIASNAQLKQLNLNASKLPSGGFKVIFRGCNALEELDLGNIRELFLILKYIQSSSLRRLRAQCCDLEYWDIKRLVNQCPNLTHLDISSNYIGLHGTQKLKTSFPTLVELINFDSLQDFSDQESDYITDTEYETEWESYDGLSD